MKTRVASVILDTHTQDIATVDSEAEERDSEVAESARSFTIVNFEDNIKSYEERTGNSLDSRFADSSTEDSLYREATSGKLSEIDGNIFKQAGELHILSGISDELRDNWNQSMMKLPRNKVFWNVDPDTGPNKSEDGDIWWQIPYQANGRDFSKAVPFKKVKGEWAEIGYQKEFFGSEIYGGLIQGGKIVGVNFESQFNDGKGEAFFHVDEAGHLHAQSFDANIDLLKETANGHNPRWYTGGYTSEGQGFFLQDGILQMKAWAHKASPKIDSNNNEDANNDDDNNNQNLDETDFSDKKYYAQTFLEPNGLKQRAYNYNYDGRSKLDSSLLIARTDVRSGRIDINDTFGDETGFTARPTYLRVGKWSDKGTRTKKSGVVMAHFGDFHKLHIHKDSLVVDSKSEFNGKVHVNNGMVLEGGDITDKNGDTIIGTDKDDDGSISNKVNKLKATGGITVKTGNLEIKNGYLISKGGIESGGNLNSDSQLWVRKGGAYINGTTVLNGESTINGRTQINGRAVMNDGITMNRGGIQLFDISGFSYFNNSWVQFNNNISVYGVLKHGAMEQMSEKSLKKNIEKIDSEKALSQLIAMDIVKYNYKDVATKDSIFIGPIIDDENEDKEYYTPEELVSRHSKESDNSNNKHDSIITNNYISYLALGIKELAKQNQELTFRLARLEREAK